MTASLYSMPLARLSVGSVSRIPPAYRTISPVLVPSRLPTAARLDSIGLPPRPSGVQYLRLSQNIGRSLRVVDFILDATVIEHPTSLASTLLMPPSPTSPSPTTKPDCSVLPPLVRAQCERAPRSSSPTTSNLGHQLPPPRPLTGFLLSYGGGAMILHQKVNWGFDIGGGNSLVKLWSTGRQSEIRTADTEGIEIFSPVRPMPIFTRLSK